MNQSDLDFRLRELTGYVTNMFLPSYEEIMRPLIETIREATPGNELVQQITSSAEEYLNHAVQYYRRQAELSHQGSSADLASDPELQELARAKQQATRRWLQLWLAYQDIKPNGQGTISGDSSYPAG